MDDNALPLLVNSNTTYIEDYYVKLQEMYNDDAFIDCMNIVQEMERKIFAGELTFRDKPNFDDTEASDYEIFKSNSLIAHIDADHELYNRCWDAFKVINTKEPDRIYDGIESWFKYEEDVNTVTICGRVTIQANIMKVLAVFAEVDLLQVDSFEDMKKLEEYSKFKWLLRCRIKMPLTFKNRESVIVGYGTPIPEYKALILPFRSVYKGYYGISPPSVDAYHEKFDINYAFYHIKYVDEDVCEITSAYNIDPNIALIPWFILNTFLKEIGYYVMRDLKKQIEQSVDSEVYRERMEKNKAFYDKIWRVISPHFQQS